MNGVRRSGECRALEDKRRTSLDARNPMIAQRDLKGA
jgi:hypothetical protein